MRVVQWHAGQGSIGLVLIVQIVLGQGLQRFLKLVMRMGFEGGMWRMNQNFAKRSRAAAVEVEGDRQGGELSLG